MNSNELLDNIIKALADAVWQKVEARIDDKIKTPFPDFRERVMEIIDDIDFDERIDTRSICQDVLSEIDVESTVRDEIRNSTFTVSVD